MYGRCTLPSNNGFIKEYGERRALLHEPASLVV